MSKAKKWLKRALISLAIIFCIVGGLFIYLKHPRDTNWREYRSKIGLSKNKLLKDPGKWNILQTDEIPGLFIREKPDIFVSLFFQTKTNGEIKTHSISLELNQIIVQTYVDTKGNNIRNWKTSNTKTFKDFFEFLTSDEFKTNQVLEKFNFFSKNLCFDLDNQKYTPNIKGCISTAPDADGAELNNTKFNGFPSNTIKFYEANSEIQMGIFETLAILSDGVSKKIYIKSGHFWNLDSMELRDSNVVLNPIPSIREHNEFKEIVVNETKQSHKFQILTKKRKFFMVTDILPSSRLVFFETKDITRVAVVSIHENDPNVWKETRLLGIFPSMDKNQKRREWTVGFLRELSYPHNNWKAEADRIEKYLDECFHKLPKTNESLWLKYDYVKNIFDELKVFKNIWDKRITDPDIEVQVSSLKKYIDHPIIYWLKNSKDVIDEQVYELCREAKKTVVFIE